MVTLSQIQWINSNLNILEYLDKVNVDIPQNGKVFCPFHVNTNTPAAKVYVDNPETGVGKIYCYVCGKSFGVFDLCKTLLRFEDEDIKNLVPIEYWYSVVDVKETITEIPVVDPADYKTFNGNTFGFLHKLDHMYRHPNLYNKRKL